MRSTLIVLSFVLVSLSARSQKWQPGVFYDIKGTKNPGFIRINPSGKAPIKDEGFIEYKESEKASPFKLSASDLRSFVVGRDSFIVAVAPAGGWFQNELDFVRVAVDAPLRLFAAYGGTDGGRGSGFGVSPGIGIGMGGGGFGGGIGGGISIPIGGGGGGRRNSKAVYFYGANTAEMKLITDQNFEDVMSEVLGDEPEIVERLKSHKYKPGNMEALIADFNRLQALPNAH